MCLDKRARTSTIGAIQPGVLYIDPPGGWRYGFPKPFPSGLDAYQTRTWLTANGYPLPYEGAADHCRYFYLEPNE